MPCYSPLQGWRSRFVNRETGLRPITFKFSEAFNDLPVTVPCGQCIGCRLERSRQWAVRCIHEAQMHESNSFITLTYDNEHLPSSGSLVPEHFTLFMKRLRKELSHDEILIRYFMCGEYGSLHVRPHYHAIIFGYSFPDATHWQTNKGITLRRSGLLERLWPYGFSTVGDCTFESAAYVARYILKKVTGDKAEEHYGNRVPEYVRMSRRPGIASDWFKKYHTDVFPADYLVVRGHKCRPPRYYDSIYDDISPKNMKKIKNKRINEAKKHPIEDSERLLTRQEARIRKISYLPRPLP